MFPRLIGFLETDSCKAIGFKIFKELRSLIYKTMVSQIETLNMEHRAIIKAIAETEKELKRIYEQYIVSNLSSPFEVWLKFKDDFVFASGNFDSPECIIHANVIYWRTI